MQWPDYSLNAPISDECFTICTKFLYGRMIRRGRWSIPDYITDYSILKHSQRGIITTPCDSAILSFLNIARQSHSH